MTDLVVAETLPNPPWKNEPRLKRILDVLNDPGAPLLTLLVGGCVRNALLGAATSDFDCATLLWPEQVTARAEAAGLKVIPTGIDHGTVTVVADGLGVEVTTLRRDVATDGRRATVAFSDDWVEDAERRDFTMNTLLAGFDGRVYDPTGQGLADLRAGRVRFVGDPAARIREDYLRILRFFRFQAWYGRGVMEADALAACRDLAPQIGTLSRERVTQEVLKWLAAPNPVPSLQNAIENDVWAQVLPGVPDLAQLTKLVNLPAEMGSADVLTRLVAVIGDDEAQLPELLRVFALSNKQINILEFIFKSKNQQYDAPEKNLKYYIYKSGYYIVLQRFYLDCVVGLASKSVFPVLQKLASEPVPVFPVGGEDLKQLGIPPGPAMGELLKKAEAWWVEQNFEPTKAEILGYIRGKEI